MLYIKIISAENSEPQMIMLLS